MAAGFGVADGEGIIGGDDYPSVELVDKSLREDDGEEGDW